MLGEEFRGAVVVVLELLRIGCVFYAAVPCFITESKVDFVAYWATDGAVLVGSRGTARTVATRQ